MEAFAATHQGHRSANEDAYHVELESGVLAVADGVSSEPGGALAARLAVGAIAEFFQGLRDPRDPELALGRMAHAIGSARRAVLDRSVGPYSRMATTVAALWAHGPYAVVAHVGDSPVFLWRDGCLERLTTDHSMCELLGDPSQLPGALSRALCARCDGRPDLMRIVLEPGDMIILCTDGVSRPLEKGPLSRIVAATAPSELARALVEQAIAVGGRDNATAIVYVAGPV
ncbi:MAG: protein phosphatase 2C domain-containing protein [Sandaracinaceae bacterium]|nr:protein phosphatase 2C domain-containing protein [Sandaracinaceae bacterium]